MWCIFNMDSKGIADKMWYQPQVWAQSFNNAMVQANEIKKKKTTSYEWFQIIFYSVHMFIGSIGILMFIYGVGFEAVATYTIELVKYTDKSTVFLPPAILSAVTIAFSFSMILNCTNGYKKILLGIYMALVIASIATCIILWKANIKVYHGKTATFDADLKYKKTCKQFCTHKDHL